MAEFDHGFKIAARFSGAGLSRLAGIVPEHWEAIGDTLQTTERLADRAFRAPAGGRRFVVYMEAHTRWVDSALWSVLSKSGLLSERERLPTRILIFVLLPEGYADQKGTFRLETEVDDPTQQVWFKEICLWKQKPQPWWQYHPGLMALYPLCDHAQTSADAVAVAAEAIRHREMDSLRRAELLATLGIMGKLVDRGLDVLSIIRREEMVDASLFPEFVLEGEQIRARKAVLQVLAVRFGEKKAKEFAESLERITDLARLEELLKLATVAPRLREFRKVISPS
jgi:hypothetical protein